MGTCDIVTVPDTENVQHTPGDLIQGDIERSSEASIEIINDIPENHHRGRQDYRTEYADIACRLTAAYFTEQDVAYALGVSLSTIRSWKAKFSGFKAACEDGKRESKKRLVSRAMRQAIGYRYIEKNVKFVHDANGEVIKSETSEFHKEQPGSERMLVFLLMNLDRQLKDKEWENINKIEVDESKSVKITIDGKSAKEQIARLAGELNADG